MYKIVGIDIKSVGNFKDVSLDFTAPLTYVRGVNKDTGLSGPTTGNGVGKSLMFAAVANLRFGSAPMSLRKNNRKEVLSSKKSSIGLIVQTDPETEYEIIQTASGYRIFKNGEDLEVKRIDRQQDFIRRLLPISEIEYYTREYLSTLRPYPMRVASNDVRLQHIIDLHQLDQYSSIKEYFARKSKEIKDDELRVGVLEQTRLDLKKKVQEMVKSSVSSEDYAYSKSRFDACSQELEKLVGRKGDLLQTQEALTELLRIETTLDALRAKYKFKRPPAEMLETLKGLRAASREWDEYKSTLKHAQASRDKLRSKLSAIDIPEVSSEDVEKYIAEVEERRSACEKSLRAATEQRESYESAREDVARLKKLVGHGKVDPDADYTAAIAVYQTSIDIEDALAHKHLDGGRCPTCNSKIDLSRIKKMAEEAREKIPELEEKLAQQKAAAKLVSAKKVLSDLSYDGDEAARLKSKREKLKSKLAALSAAKDVWGTRTALQTRIDSIELPEEPKAYQPDLGVDDIEAGVDQCQEIEKHLSAKSSLLRKRDSGEAKKLRSAKSVKAALEEVSEQLAGLEKKYARAEKDKVRHGEKVAKYSTAKSTLDVYRRELKDTDKKLGALKAGYTDKKLIDILVKCYGPKGLRAVAADSVCKLLENNLNQYRDLLFYEPFIFSVEASESGVSITVDRNNGSPMAVTDVRQLSGAESNAFDLLFCLAELMITPDARKTNMLVLDEPTCHMDESTRVLFNERYLPAVQDLVPNVYVVTPHADDCRPNSAEWSVQKHKGVSCVKIMQGNS